VFGKPISQYLAFQKVFLVVVVVVGLIRLGLSLAGNFPPQPGVAGPVDFAHPAGAERRHDLVGAEPGPGWECHPVTHREF
jgi:hypothetical protein